MRHLFVKALWIVLLIVFSAAPSQGQIVEFVEDFESLDINSPTALSDANWLVFGNLFDPDGNFLSGYGPFGAPNGDLDGGGFRFSALTTEQGGPDQGMQQLVVFNDYNNESHGDGSNNIIESNVFREFTITADNVGTTYRFGCEFKTGDLEAPATAVAFIKTLDPNNNFELTNFATFATDASTDWFGGFIDLTIDASLVGQIYQIGFLNTASNFVPSGVIYDNVSVIEAPDCLVGDLDGSGDINLLDVTPFVEALTNGTVSCEADINGDGAVDLLDVGPFVDLLSG